MENPTRHLTRLAGTVCQRLNRACRDRSNTTQAPLDRLCRRLANIGAMNSGLEKCTERGWDAAATVLLQRLRYRLPNILSDADELHRILNSDECRPVTHRQVFSELRALEEELGAARYDRDDCALTAITDPIVLEGVHLGRFEIRLLLDRLDEPDPQRYLRIVALEPNPSVRNQDVTHPHVKQERPCVGDAGTSIEQALKTGRLCDLFMMVRSVLQTYNGESPFVELEHWEGRPCFECEQVVGPDDSFCCERCEHDFCHDCIACCGDCSLSCCAGCIDRCGRCGESCCADCLTTCTRCGQLSCSSCVEESLCTTCREKDTHENEPQSDSQDSCDPGRVGGQRHVPAALAAGAST